MGLMYKDSTVLSIPRKRSFRYQTIWTGDDLNIVRGVKSDCIDLIHLGPPFISNTGYVVPVVAKHQEQNSRIMGGISLAWHWANHEQDNFLRICKANMI